MTARYASALVAVATLGAALAFAVPARAQGDMDTPDIGSAANGIARTSVTLTAGPSGAPAGFTVWWMKESDYIANGNSWFLYGDPRQGEAYFWGTPSLNTNGGQYTTFTLAPNQSITVQIGDLADESGVTVTSPSADASTGAELEYGTSYVFCAFANGTVQTYQSGLTLTVQSATQLVNCTFTQGYWKTHPSAWPASCLPMTLGNNSYTQSELLAILGQPVQGNGSISLAHQLIAAKLNVCQGAASNAIASAIASAQAQLAACGSNKLKPVGAGPYCSLTTSSTDSNTNALDNFNNGVTGPGHCGDTPAATSTWGRLKAIYR
ncbi:MAG: hypothetical protein HY076_04705 [Candidatus Eisenbacteria bacterium]|uniref:Ig-like domain-containing protein n=1 Tax=Eiseniibacteriota bacterium TaxID=2212470 RepID=A0A9D6L6K4_UNCEI|nr:hypothetical protein [Candidatus Eisenbacteria bacterium]MBI3539551.1 hypothetical protein [Candidatus Eisenbacteria bacterium]